MNRRILYIIIISLICLYIFLIYKYFADNGFVLSAELGNYLSGIFAPLSAFGTLFVSYYIYKMTSKESRADNDFRQIIKTYQRIADSYEMLKQYKERDNNSEMTTYYERKLKVDSILMVNLINRYPSKNINKQKLIKNLYGINVNPNYESDYKELAENIQNFCYELDPEVF